MTIESAGLRRGRVRRVTAAWIVGAVGLAAAAGPQTAVADTAAPDCKATAAPGISWRDCNKSKLLLADSALDGADLSGTDFSYTDLRGSSLDGAKLEKATLMRSSLAGAKAAKADFSRIEGYRTVFAEVLAAGATFASAELQRADFKQANLSGANFQKAELGRADFSGALLTGAQFSMANLSRVQFAKARFEGALDFSGAFLLLTHIEGLDLSQATGLQQWQVDQACGDGATKLPAGLKPSADWPCTGD